MRTFRLYLTRILIFIPLQELQEIKKQMSSFEKLQRELSLKQLQINSLLAITQAINDNVNSEGLFAMYNKFLSWELGVEKMAFLFKENGHWICVTSIGVNLDLMGMDIADELRHFTGKKGVKESNHPFCREFDLVIPILHKMEAIAYSFIGGFRDKDDDIYNKINFITTISNIIAVAIENKRLFKQQMQQSVIDKEMDLAAKIQRTLVPTKLPSSNKFALSSIYKPHYAVGGDYYDVVEFPDGKLAFCIADISGKGISAALLMANFQANLHSLLHKGATLEEMVHEMNQEVLKVTEGDRFITLFLAKYDPKDKSLQYINAGHVRSLLVTGNEIVELGTGCTLLGVFDKLPKVEIGGICITAPDAFLFNYTDGITDVCDKNGDTFSEDRLQAFLLQNNHLDPQEFNKKLMNHLDNFRKNIPFPDDITVLSCKFF